MSLTDLVSGDVTHIIQISDNTKNTLITISVFWAIIIIIKAALKK